MASFVYGMARRLTWFGALVLAIMSLLSVVSIIGRALTSFGLSPVPGDFELVEIGAAVAVFSFLPWAHLSGSHAFVDLFWSRFPPRMQSALIALFDALTLFIWTVLTWRLIQGTVDYKAAGEETFILHLPLWWAYAMCSVIALLGLLAYAWRLAESLGLAQPPAGFTTNAASQ